jgi:putative endonuclease
VKTFYVYMMTNRSRAVLYTGVTNSLESRLWFHANNEGRSFAKRYKVDRLVYYESYDDPRGRDLARERNQRMAPRKEE